MATTSSWVNTEKNISLCQVGSKVTHLLYWYLNFAPEGSIIQRFTQKDISIPTVNPERIASVIFNDFINPATLTSLYDNDFSRVLHAHAHNVAH